MNTAMDEFFDKIKSIGSEIEEEVGGLVLFGVFKTADTPHRWDVLVSADWVGEDNAPAIYYIGHKLQDRLSVEELVSISRIEALPPSSDFVRSVLRTVRVTGGGEYLEYRVYNGISILEAYVAAANPDAHSHSPLPASAAPRHRKGGATRTTERRGRRAGTSPQTTPQ